MLYKDRRGGSKYGAQHGFTLIELMVVLGIGAIIAAMGAREWSKHQDRILATTAATQQLHVARAARRYLKDHYSSLDQSLNGSHVERLDQVIADGYLDDAVMGSNHVNPMGQVYRIYYAQASGDDAPIQTMVLASGDPATSRQVQHQMTRKMGTSAAYVEGNTLTSPYYEGSFEYSLAPFGQSGAPDGSVAMFDSLERQAAKSDYLYRHAVGGFPELNQMKTALLMDGNDIKNAGGISAVAIEASHDIRAGRNISAAQDLIAERNVRANKNVIAGNDVRADRNVTAERDVKADRDLTAVRDVDAGRYVHLAYRGHYDGDSCVGAGRGAVTVDADGKILSCQSGAWTSIGAAQGMKGVFKPLAGQTTAWCAAEGSNTAIQARILEDGTPQYRLRYPFGSIRPWTTGVGTTVTTSGVLRTEYYCRDEDATDGPCQGYDISTKLCPWQL